jgi:hypothetical protein
MIGTILLLLLNRCDCPESVHGNGAGEQTKKER